MQEWLEALVLGIIQGLTEFLPISSSGHLELAKFFLDYDEAGEASLLMTVTLHAATALATIFVFRKDIAQILKGMTQKPMNESWHFTAKIILSMIPAAMVGIALESEINSLFDQKIMLVCGMLLVTALLLFLADRAKSTDRKVSYKDALIIGIAQAVAIMPGISRSGSTIATSVILGNDRVSASRFSFLMVVPLILGKMAKDLMDGDFSSDATNIDSLLIGFIAAFITGIIACKWMLFLVKKAKLKIFAIYCIIIAMSVATYLWLSK